MLNFGGHSGAVGLSLEAQNLQNFITFFSTHLVLEETKGEDNVLGCIKSIDIDNELMECIEAFEPFGAGNPTPLFVCEQLSIESIKPLGKEGKHFEYILLDKQSQTRLRGVEFFAPCVREVGQCGDVYFELIKDDYFKSIKLKIVDFV